VPSAQRCRSVSQISPSLVRCSRSCAGGGLNPGDPCLRSRSTGSCELVAQIHEARARLRSTQHPHSERRGGTAASAP
jgi:hypothetical protein